MYTDKKNALQMSGVIDDWFKKERFLKLNCLKLQGLQIRYSIDI